MPTPRKTSSASTPRVAGGTRRRIIDCSIELFNRHGIQSVTIEQICTELKISPGNLTYHFKRKDDLTRATLDALKEQMRVALQRPELVNSAQNGAEYLVRVFVTFWKFRFFFNALAYLLTDDVSFRKDYEELRSWVIDTIEEDVRYLSSKGLFLKPVPPNNFRLLADNIWALLLNWLRLQQIATPTAAAPPRSGLFSMALHMWSMCQLWMNPSFSTQLLETFEGLLGPAAKRPAAAKAPRKTAKQLAN